MSEPVILRVEASHGCRVTRGKCVRRGQVLGTKPDGHEPLLCPCDGLVTALGFEAAAHQYVLEIEPND